MNLPMQNIDAYVFSKQPGYHEPTVRKAFAKAVPLRTVMTAFAVTTVKADEGRKLTGQRRGSQNGVA